MDVLSDTAVWLANWLVDQAYVYKDQATWIEEQDDSSLSSLDGSVYSGGAGIALALDRLGVVSGDRRWDAWANRAMAPASGMPDASFLPSGGFYSGITGVSVVQRQIGVGPPREPSPSHVLSEPGDLMQGSIAEAIGFDLLSKIAPNSAPALTQTATTNLVTPIDRTWTRSGLAHGMTGLYALAGSWSVEEAVADLQQEELNVTGPPWSWCNGRIGVYAVTTRWSAPDDSRIRSLRRILDLIVDPQLMHLGDDSLCHGRFGAIVISAAIARKLGDPDLLQAALQAAVSMAEARQRSGSWRVGGMSAEPKWSLMSGVAGLVWGLCALLEPPELDVLQPWNAPPAHVQSAA